MRDKAITGEVCPACRCAHAGYALETDEAQELGKSFAEKRKPDPERFGH